MLINSKAVHKPTDSAHSKWDSCVKMTNVKCTWSMTLHDNCNQSIMPCGPDEVSIKSETGPVRVFHAFTKAYTNQKHTELFVVMFGNLVSSWIGCVCEQRNKVHGQPLEVAVLSVDGSLSPLRVNEYGYW